MKKFFLSISTLVTLTIFGGLVFIIVSKPAGPASNAAAPAVSAGSVPASAPAQAPLFSFDPAAISYEVSHPNYEWIDISASSDEQIIAKDFEDNVGSAAIDIGFYFPFFKNIYSQVRLSDNGYVYFDGDETTGRNTPQTVPTDVDLVHNLIAPFGADLFRNPGDSIVYIARQSEPERRLVVQFKNAYWCCNLENPNNFQVILYPDGRILTQYESIQNEHPPHAYLAVGIENEDGSQGHHFFTGFLDETDILHNQLAILYDPDETLLGRLLFIPETDEVQGAPGQTVTFKTNLLNLSGVDSNFTITQTLQINGVEAPLQPVDSEEPKETGDSDEPDNVNGTDGADETSETGDAGEAASTWRMNILAEPGQVNHTYAKPLTVEIIISETATADDTAVITFRASPEAITDLEANATFTIEITAGNPGQTDE
jgi:hypothetical protein